MKLSVLIPAHNEEGSLTETLKGIYRELASEHIEHELLVVNDNSSDGTESLLQSLSAEIPTLRYINNLPPNGFGRAIKRGLMEFSGDCVAIVMADGSDAPSDIVKFFRKIEEGYDCAFGSRFMEGGKTIDYPGVKRVLNRMGNWLIKKVFNLPYDDITNAFKCYRREVIQAVSPILANHFNITVEIPIKAIIYGYSYAVVPNSWTNRKAGVSKLNIRKMAAQYLLIILFLFLAKYIAGERADAAAKKAESAPQETGKSGWKAKLAIVSFFFLAWSGSNYFWLKADHSLITWDWGVHVNDSIHTNVFPSHLKELKTLREKTDYLLGALYYGKNRYYPSLFCTSAIPARMIFGSTADGIAMTNAMYILVLMAAYLLLSVKLGLSDRALFLACLATLSFSMMVSLTREDMIDFSAASLAFLAIVLVAYSDYFGNRARSVFFGIALGLSLLAKWNAMYIVFPMLAVVFFTKKIYRSRKGFLNMAIALAAAFVISAPWYLTNRHSLIEHSKVFHHTPLHFRSLTSANFTNFYDAMKYMLLSSYPVAILAVVCLAVFLMRRKSYREQPYFAYSLIFALVLWLFLPPIPIPRMATVTVFIIAFIMAGYLDAFLRSFSSFAIRAVLTGAAVILLAAPYFFNLGVNGGAAEKILGDMQVIRHDYKPCGKPWGLELAALEIRNDYALNKPSQAKYPRVFLYKAGRPFFDYYGLCAHAFIIYTETIAGGGFNHGDTLDLPLADYVLYLDSKPLSSAVDDKPLLSALRSRPARLRFISEFPLDLGHKGACGIRQYKGDYSRIIVYKVA